MMEVTLQLPDRVYQQAQRWATLTNQDFDNALTEAFEVALTSVYAYPEADVPVDSLNDEEVLALTEMQMPLKRGQRLSQLSERHSEDALSSDEQQELMALAGLYQQYWMRQAEALAEAVRRGRLPAMHS